MSKLELVGSKFGRLLVLSEEPKRNQKTYWLCLCDCGNKKIVQGGHLVAGHTSSCGCYHKERTSECSPGGTVKHGQARRSGHSIEYQTWSGMWSRCTDEKQKAFGRYGGRGITVCARWKSFAKFLADMGPRPADRSLDRIDNNKGYSPGNCRWATKTEQSRNTRTARYVIFNNQKFYMAELATLLNVPRTTVTTWHRKNNGKIQELLTTLYGA